MEAALQTDPPADQAELPREALQQLLEAYEFLLSGAQGGTLDFRLTIQPRRPPAFELSVTRGVPPGPSRDRADALDRPPRQDLRRRTLPYGGARRGA